ncbi:hypothetical protein Ga0074812_10412 [Parafrankia irregularis]|uniref:NurA domain-containing protein n=1 Tax=Parafrankia irregularis TaxID=795642 RepID=A0A0S4QHI3_9ACTN|nr:MULTISPECIES: hypothetical protein [Parafrankia]CUU54935.1 hypothetical protein Ga0074812_10412 [Parafrankia irregularis]
MSDDSHRRTTAATTASAVPAPRAGVGGMRFSVDAWDPSYGTSVADDGLKESKTPANAGVEVPVPAWRPVPTPAARGLAVTPPSAVLFVDGVRRVEARAWIHETEPAGTPADGAPTDGAPADGVAAANIAAPAICASYAGGVVCCCGAGAHLLAAHVRRGLFTSARQAGDVRTAEGTYHLHQTDGAGPDDLNLALQRELRGLEMTTALGAHRDLRAHHPFPATEAHGADGAFTDALLVVDGPLHAGALPRTLGFVKTHHSSYLEGPPLAVVGRLGPGERTPVFTVGRSWDRPSWYLRLPCRPGAPWAGIVRVECGSGTSVDHAVELADLSQATLPRFASQEFKDARAPQNLYPIAGLERTLRRRLGDAQLLYRSLRRGATA